MSASGDEAADAGVGPAQLLEDERRGQRTQPVVEQAPASQLAHDLAVEDALLVRAARARREQLAGGRPGAGLDREQLGVEVEVDRPPPTGR